MSFFSGLAELRDPDAGLTNPSHWLNRWFGGGVTTKAGTVVTEANALKLWAAYACVNLLARTLGQLPCVTYERLDRGRRRAPDHQNFEILKLRPNPEMSAFSFFRCVTSHLETWGNAYALIDFDLRGRLSALWPISPHRVKPYRLPNSKALVYRLTLPQGGEDVDQLPFPLPQGDVEMVPPEKMLHISGLGYDGIVGHSRIEMARELLGKGFALEEFTSTFFSQGTHAGLVISHPDELGAEGRASLEKSLSTDYAGLGKSHKILLLEEAMKVEKVGFPPDQAQFIQTQELTLRQICGFWSVPPYMLGLQDKEPKASTEQKGLDFLTYTVGALLIAWEQELNWKLFTPAERKRYYSEFLVDSLLRATIKDRFEAYKTARYAGFMDGNEIRERENLNPKDGLDEAWIPTNMYPASLAETILLKPDTTKAERDDDPSGLRAQYLPLLEERLSDLLRREVADVKRAARKMIDGQNIEAFEGWMDDYYTGHHARVDRHLLATITSAAAAADIDETEIDLDTATAWSSDSRSRLDAALLGEDPYRSVVRELETWDATRVHSTALDELNNLLIPPEE